MPDEHSSLLATWIGPAHRGTLASLEDPRFEAAERVHDWRNHVGDAVRSIWNTLDIEQRAAIAIDAAYLAYAEEWE